ncbi:MAG TPA: sulfotransferase [Methylomirabilota bacterium]|nr:sulfotransferase [Methylomirabilota bacterium]
MVDADGRGLCFLLSTPRAGSTLLGALLATHRDVHCPPEPWLLLPLKAISSDDVVLATRYDHDLARLAWRTWTEGGLGDDAVRAFAVTVYNGLLVRAAKRIFVDKTPRYYQILSWLGALFPAAKQVWLRRNPLDVVASYKHTWGISVDQTTGIILSPASFDVTVGLDTFAASFAAPSPRRATLRYEDLVQRPVPELASLCTFLDLPFEPAMLDYGTTPDHLQAHFAHVLGDKKLLHHHRPHAESVNRWRDLLTTDEVRKVVLTLGPDLFDRLGYRDALAEAADRVGMRVADLKERGQLDALRRLYESRVEWGLESPVGPSRAGLASENARLERDLGELRLAHEHLVRAQARLESDLHQLRRAQDHLTHRLQRAQTTLAALTRSRVYRLMRRLGRWAWLESALVEAGRDADEVGGGQVSADRGAPGQ